MTTNLNFTDPSVGAVGPGWAASINDALSKIDAAHDVSANAYGAVGDNATIAANDIAIANAIAAAGIGGRVRFGPGVYKTLLPVTYANHLTELVGCGPGNTIIRTTSPTNDVISANGKVLVGLRDIQIDSAITRIGGSGIGFTNVGQYLLDNVRIFDTYNYGTFLGGGAGSIRRLRGAWGGGAFNRGFYFQGAGGGTNASLHFDDVFVNGGGVVAALGATSGSWFQFDDGIDTVLAHQFEVVNSTGGGALPLRFTHTGSGVVPRWVHFDQFAFEGSDGAQDANGQNGIQLDAVNQAYFTNGQIQSSVVGIYLGSGAVDPRFFNVQISNCDTHGIYALSESLDVAGCTISDNSQLTHNTYSGIVLGTGVAADIGHTYFGDKLLGSSKKMKYGIDMSGNVSTRVHHLRQGNLGTGLINGGVGLQEGFYGNPGYYREGVGAAATDLPTALTLLNNLRTVFLHNGMVS